MEGIEKEIEDACVREDRQQVQVLSITVVTASHCLEHAKLAAGGCTE